MRAKQKVGTKYLPDLDHTLTENQKEIVDDLVTPHAKYPPDEHVLSSTHGIVSKVPAHEPDAQPVQARGRIVWNRAYQFQSQGPSFLDGSDR